MIDLLQISIPEWEGHVCIKVWSSEDFDKVLSALDSRKNFRAVVASVSICDENGSKLFEVSDIEWLAKKSGTAIDRIYQQALVHNHLCGLTKRRESLRESPHLMFKHRLALNLGKSLAEIDASMDARERVQWWLYDQIEPIPNSWLQTGMTISNLARLHGVKKTKPTDFIPSVKPPIKPMTSEQMKNHLRSVAKKQAKNSK